MNSKLAPLIRDRGFDNDKILQYRAGLQNDNQKHFYDKLVASTKYVSHNELCDKLKTVVDSIKAPLFNVFINYYSDEAHSEEWCIALCWPYLTHRVSKVFLSFNEITDDLPLVLIDDCIYTGVQMCSTLMHISNNAKIESKLEIIFATAYASTYINRLLHLLLIGKLNSSIKVDISKIQITEFIVGGVLQPIGGPALAGESLESVELLGSEITSIPIYFDHKIANKHGSFPQIYENIMRHKPSRLGINLCHTLLTQYNENDYNSYKQFLDDYLL